MPSKTERMRIDDLREVVRMNRAGTSSVMIAKALNDMGINVPRAAHWRDGGPPPLPGAQQVAYNMPTDHGRWNAQTVDAVVASTEVAAAIAGIANPSTMWSTAQATSGLTDPFELAKVRTTTLTIA
ncbi:hypothetical protein [Pseudonocardia sp. WMMC193]|uniref:hypothetical protein n=1 Tax=Pseudonocardia sp. WMMC193 TaxID=2911965 RepID=UPI001F394116|nr:hypothetical protein [Pseudonocardia sp. WMMC193]MCF7548512.1 hypothetical protein [Pseudonocardia sp. WMMC193]